MSFSLSFFLATRYIFSKSTSSIRTMITVCFASIFIGTCSLALITSIMRGFEYETHKKLQGIYPSIFIKAPEGTTLSYSKIETFLKKELTQEVSFSAPYVLKDALLHPATTNRPLVLVTIKGIDPTQEQFVTALGSMLEQQAKLTDVTSHKILIGKTIAEQLQVQPGDQAVLICNQQDDIDFNETAGISVPVTITGILKTGIADYDEHLVIISLALCKKIWGDDCITHCGIALKHDSYEKSALEKLKVKKLDALSWKDCFLPLVSALRLEKYVMFFILLLITLIASMNIVSLLFMFITHKQTDIALLKLLGLHDRYIYALFLFIGCIIATIASLAGLLVAYIIGIILQMYPIITLPDIYYVTHVPITLEPSIFILIFTCTIGLVFVASLLPLKNLRNLNITRTLRFE